MTSNGLSTCPLNVGVQVGGHRPVADRSYRSGETKEVNE